MADIFELFKKIGSESKINTKPEFIVVGLGNPGVQYEGTRHNAGYDAIDSIADKLSLRIVNSKFKSLTCIGTISEKGVLLMKPQTYMNLSGDAVAEAANFYKIPAENIIVLSDDICQEVGRIRIRKSGSAGGHNGLGDIIKKTGSDKFMRIRIGVGEKPNPEYDLADWVLGKLSSDDRKCIAERHGDILSAVEMIFNGKTDEAMGLFNGKRSCQ